MPRYRRKSHLLKLEFTLEYKKSDLRKICVYLINSYYSFFPCIFRFWALKRARLGGTDLSKSYGINPSPPGRYIYLTYRRFRLYLKTKRFPLRYTHLQRRLYRTRITQRRLRFLRLRRITRLLLLRLLLLLVLLLLRFRRRLRRRLRRCLLRFRRNRPRL